MLRGKGIWIRRIIACENGNLDSIVARARAASFTHVLIQIADGADPYNLDFTTGFDHARELTARLTAAGIEVWGWQQVYGDTPLFKGALRPDYHLAEAERAITRLEGLRAAGVRGFAVVASGDYERAYDRARKAEQYSSTIRSGLRDLSIALSAWKHPRRHPRFPWAEFRAHCDFDLPQVFWIGKHGEAAKQLEISTRKFAALNPRLPYVPAGPAFFEHDWRPAPDDLVAFLEQAIALGLPAANLWEWDDLGLIGDERHNPHHLDFQEHWKAVADFKWIEPTFVPFWLRDPESAEAVRAAPAEPERPAPSPVVAPPQAAAPIPFPPPEPEEFEPARPHYPDDEESRSRLDFAPGLSFALEPEADELPEWLQEPGPASQSESAISFGIEDQEDLEPAQPHYPEAAEGVPVAAPAPAFALETPSFDIEHEFEPARPYHPEVEAEPVNDSEVRFALEIEEAALPDWLQEAEAVEPLFPAEPGEGPEPVEPYRLPAEPGPVSEPDWRIALEIEEAALPDWLKEPELVPATPEYMPPVGPVEEFEPDWPYHPDLEPEPPAEPRPSLAPDTEQAIPAEPLEPQPFTEPEEESEPARPHYPDQEEPETNFDFAPALGLAVESEDEELPEWLRESEPMVVAPVSSAPIESAEEYEPMRPYYPDEASEPEALPTFSLVAESEDEELPVWLREFESAAIEAEPEPVVFEAQPEPVAVIAPEPASPPQPGPRLTAAPARPKGLVTAPAAPAIAEGDTVSRFFSALRNGQLDEAVALYGPEFSHVNPQRVERDRAAVRDFYERMLQRVEGAGLVWLIMRRTRLAASAQWVTCDQNGRPMQGVDSFHLNRAGQIVYHHTSFRLGTE